LIPLLGSAKNDSFLVTQKTTGLFCKAGISETSRPGIRNYSIR